MKRIILCLCLMASPALAALANTVQWDVRTTGVDTNGGGFDAGVTIPGQDFSQQNAAQVAFTDLVIGGTTTQLTSALSPFATCTAGVGRCGNLINITGGTGCTVGWYEILSTSTITATMDRSVGTAASTCTGNLGGSLLTLPKAVSLMVDGNSCHIKTGTYTLTSTLSVGTFQSGQRFVGYATTHNDGGAAPTITTATNSTVLFTPAQNISLILDNLILTNTAAVRAVGVDPASGAIQVQFRHCVLDGFSVGTNGQNLLSLFDTEIKNCTSHGVALGAACLTARYCWIHNNGGYGVSFGSANTTQRSADIYRSVFSSNTTGGIGYTSTQLRFFHLTENVFYSNTGAGLIDPSGAGNHMNDPADLFNHATDFALENNIFYGNGTYGVSVNVIGWPITNRNNAYGANSTAARLNLPAGSGDVTLTGNPFTNAGAGDFSLNATAGAGAACAGVGYPATFAAGLSTASASALGIAQASSGGGGGTMHGYTFSRNKPPEGVLGVPK